jgi:predicted adenine nucleotide alpha hydrolase (AANH) superfamily ATPase
MKQKLLLHSCCGPCSTSVIEKLKEEFDLAVFFYNPNIYPKEEYKNRLEAEVKFCNAIGIRLIEGEYDHERWLSEVKGLENEKEGGARCEVCFKMRLEATAAKAKDLEFDYFAATLSVSPHKDYKLISKLGSELAMAHNIKFLDRDFKKENGYKRSIDLSKEHDLYRQNYCGCEFSIDNK